jgi:hypothetical protein
MVMKMTAAQCDLRTNSGRVGSRVIPYKLASGHGVAGLVGGAGKGEDGDSESMGVRGEGVAD